MSDERRPVGPGEAGGPGGVDEGAGAGGAARPVGPGEAARPVGPGEGAGAGRVDEGAGAGGPGLGNAAGEPGGGTAAGEADRLIAPRPLIERIGLAAIALVLAALFGAVAVAAWFGGEIFLAVMGATGCLMTLWVGSLTLFRR